MFTQECLLRNVGEAKMHVMLELTKLGYSPMYMKFKNNVGGNNMVDHHFHLKNGNNLVNL